MDRRKDSLFWKIVERSTNLVFLLLAIVILSKQWNDDKVSSQVVAEKKVILDVLDNRTYYLESKINKVSELSDSYQLSMSRKVEIIEERMAMQEKQNRYARITQRQFNSQNVVVNGDEENKNNSKK
jgi:hypothetical protein